MKIITQNPQDTNNNGYTVADNAKDVQARQQLNRMYMETTGPQAKLKAIKILYIIAMVFAGASIFGSQAGFYYDFHLFAPDWGRIPAVVLAVAFDALRVAGVLVFFSYRKKEQYLIRYVAMSMVIMVTIIASILHIRGMQSMEVVVTQNSIGKVLEHQYAQQKANLAFAKELKAGDREDTRAVLQNKFAGDDGVAVTTMAGTNALISQLFKKNELSKTEYMYLQGKKSQASIIKKVMYIVLPLIEFFAFLSLFVAYLKTQSVSKGVVEIRDTRETLEELEANYTTLAKEQMIADFHRNHPTLSTDEQEQKKIGATSTHPTPPTSTGAKGEVWSNAKTDHPTLPTTAGATKIIGMDNTFFRGTAENFTSAYESDGFKVEQFPIVPKKKKKQKKTRIIKELGEFKIVENPVIEEQTTENDSGVGSTALELDLLKFNFVDSQIILAAWDNGVLGVGDRLIKKSLVLAELEEQGIKEDNYVTLFRRLKKQGMVTFEMGYVSNAKLINGVTNVG